jgi:hypothetical protein
MSKVNIDYTPVHIGRGRETLADVHQGEIPTASSILRLSDGLNHLLTGRGQVFLAQSSDIGLVSNFDVATDSQIVTHQAHFVTSKNCRNLNLVLVMVPAPSNGTTTEAYAWVNLFGIDGTAFHPDKIRVGGRVPSASQCADNLFVVSQKIPVEGDTWYTFQLVQQNRAAVVSITLFEDVESLGLDTDDYFLVDTTKISAHGPILAETQEEILRVAHEVWRAPRPLLTFSAEHGSSTAAATTYVGGTTSATSSNVFDTTKTSAGSDDQPVFYLDLDATDGKLDGGDGDGALVPVVFSVSGFTPSAGAGVIELRNNFNSTKATINLYTDGLTSSGWKRASCVLDAANDTHLCIYHRSPSGQAVRLMAANVIKRHVVDPRDIDGLAAWYRADSISQSYGTNVNTWVDDSGNGYDLTAAATPPTFENVTTRGAGVRFSGGGTCYMSHADPGGALYASEDLTLIVVCKADDGTPAARQVVCGYAHSAGAGGSRWELGLDTTGDRYYGVNNSLGTIGLASYTARWEAITVHSWRVPSNVHSHNNNPFVDAPDIGPITYPNTTGLFVGAESSVSPHPFDGEIYEILVYQGLTPSQELELCHYAAVRWGVTED